MGYLAISEGTPFVAQGYFEEALMHYPNHPSAIVGLCNILLDIYSETILPPPTVPGIEPSSDTSSPKSTTAAPNINGVHASSHAKRENLVASSTPLGLGGNGFVATSTKFTQSPLKEKSACPDDDLPAPYKATSLPLVDRLAARDRAYGLLSGLTKLGTGWNYSDAWFALARAYEESGQLDKAKEALWWCVGGYVL